MVGEKILIYMARDMKYRLTKRKSTYGLAMRAIGRPCTLLRYYNLCLNKSKSTDMCRRMQSTLNFSNEAQLLISEESISDLNNRIKTNVQKGAQGTGGQIDPMRFRPNLVISGGEPYAEDGWRNLKIGNKYFTSLGGLKPLSDDQHCS